MILSDVDILSAIRRGKIGITPFRDEHLGPNSYDVTLGPELLTYKLHDERGYRCDLDCRKPNPTARQSIPEHGVRLLPGVLYLGSTVEVVESLAHVPRLSGKSSLGRLGLAVHVTAGEGDVGFCGQWTLEMTVVHPLVVYAGMPVAQVTWSTLVRPPSRRYGDRPGSKYQGQSGPTPSEMHRNFGKE